MTTKHKIPLFKSVQEDASVWDAHDTTDFEDQFESLDQTLAVDEYVRLTEMYKALQAIKGSGQDQSKPQSVDEILYGKNGAWRGTMSPSRHSSVPND